MPYSLLNTTAIVFKLVLPVGFNECNYDVQHLRKTTQTILPSLDQSNHNLLWLPEYHPTKRQRVSIVFSLLNLYILMTNSLNPGYL